MSFHFRLAGSNVATARASAAAGRTHRDLHVAMDRFEWA